MIHTRICAQCGKRASEAATAMRYHEADLTNGLSLNIDGYLTEEGRRQLAPAVIKSFINAKTAWDAYCQHLDEHGLLQLALEGKTAD